MAQRVKYTRPTVRLDKEFNDELKIMLIKNETTFQELTTKLLENWYIDQLYKQEQKEKDKKEEGK